MDNWRSRTELPLIVAALAFLGAYAWPILDPELSPEWVTACETMLWVTWVLFAADYVVRFALADNRGGFFIRHLHDLAVVVLPLLRPLRLLRLVTLLGVLNRRAGTALRGHVVIYISGGTVLVLLLASLAMLDAERGNPGAQIESFSDALWWAVVSTTTVGYGDIVPTTDAGRVIAFGLMLAGIALLGAVTATLASWLMEKVEEGHQETRETRSDVAELAAEVRELRALLAQHTGQEPAPRAGKSVAVADRGVEDVGDGQNPDAR